MYFKIKCINYQDIFVLIIEYFLVKTLFVVLCFICKFILVKAVKQ